MTSYTQAPIASATAHTGTLASVDLSGYDFEQAKLMDERCIVVDENDKPLGALDKKTCRSLHRAPCGPKLATVCPYKTVIYARPLDGEHQ